VRAGSVVALHPLLGNLSHFSQRRKEISIKNIFSIGAIETLDISVLGWFP
jgi:hypothetical protein